MADKKVSELTELTTPALDDKIPILDTSADTELKYIQKSNLVSSDMNVNVKDYGATGDGVTDDTSAIQSALNTGENVFFPQGDYLITSALYPGGYDQIISGAGANGAGKCSKIHLSGAINGFEDNSSLLYTRVIMRDLRIEGDASTLNGINFEKLTYNSEFKNINIYVGKKCIYMPSEFSIKLENIVAASYGDNAIEINGGVSTVLIQCYPTSVPAGYTGYRVYKQATFLSCNGIDSGDSWAVIGQTVADDGVNNQFKATFIGCNFESFDSFAVKLKYNGVALFERCTFNPSSSYDTCIWTTFCDKWVKVSNCAFNTTGLTRSKASDYYGDGAVKYVDMNASASWNYDKNGTPTAGYYVPYTT